MQRGYRVGYAAIGGIIGGSAALHLLAPTPSTAWMLMIGGGSVAVLASFVTRMRIGLPVCMGLLTALAAWHLQDKADLNPPQDTIGIPVIVEGRIIDAPDRRFGKTAYVVESDAFHGYVRVDADSEPRFNEGDAIQVEGALRRPMPESYQRYLALSNIGVILTADRIDVLTPRRTTSLTTALHDLRANLEERINRIYPEPHASLLAGLILGSRRGMPKHVEDEITAVGLTHIVAVSGYNVTLVATTVFCLLCWVPLTVRILVSAVGIALFAILTGGGAPVVRAAVMGCLGLAALLFSRKTDVRLSILWTLCVLGLWHPLQPWHDMGFQLSFLSVIGLAEFGHLVQPLTAYLPNTAGLREQMTTTLSAQITTTPWIAWMFGRVSLISPLANVLVAPAIPLAMFLGMISLALNLFSPFLARLVGMLTWAALEWILKTAEILAAVPYATINVQAGPWFIACYYALLVVVFVLTKTGTGRASSSDATPAPAPSLRAQDLAARMRASPRSSPAEASA